MSYLKGLIPVTRLCFFGYGHGFILLHHRKIKDTLPPFEPVKRCIHDF